MRAWLSLTLLFASCTYETTDRQGYPLMTRSATCPTAAALKDELSRNFSTFGSRELNNHYCKAKEILDVVEGAREQFPGCCWSADCTDLDDIQSTMLASSTCRRGSCSQNYFPTQLQALKSTITHLPKICTIAPESTKTAVTLNVCNYQVTTLYECESCSGDC
jgi:hypothetical protein